MKAQEGATAGEHGVCTRNNMKGLEEMRWEAGYNQVIHTDWLPQLISSSEPFRELVLRALEAMNTTALLARKV